MQNNPIGRIDIFGLAEYDVRWHYESASYAGMAMGRVSGIVVAKEKSEEGDCCGLREAVEFEGLLFGVSVGSPIGGTYNNREVFSDRYNEPDVRRVQGGAVVLSGSIALENEGKSGGAYRFGELYGTNTNVSNAEGYDLGVDYVGGYTWTVGDVFCVQ